MTQNIFQHLLTSINKEIRNHNTQNPNIEKKRRKKAQKKTAPKIKKEITIPNTKTPNYTYQNKKLLLRCGDIERNPGPKFTLLLNHPQSHQEKHKTYFYKNTTQIKFEYAHIFESFEPYLNQTQTNTTNQQLTQFSMNNHHCPKNQLFYALLITLAPTPTQCNQLIGENSTQWTTNLIRKLTNNTNPLPSGPHILQKFHSENQHITKPSDNKQKRLYSYITTERPNLETLQQEFPYLPENMTKEALKCLHPIPNFTLPNTIQNHPILNPRNTPHTIPATNILTWNCGTLNTTLPGLQSLINKPTPLT
jgi:hypothetical protein